MRHKSQNIKRIKHNITLSERNKFNGHKSGILYFTGGSEYQKTTLISKLEMIGCELGLKVSVINNAIVNNRLCQNTESSDSNKNENCRRAAEMAYLMTEAGFIVLTDLDLFKTLKNNSYRSNEEYIHTEIKIRPRTYKNQNGDQENTNSESQTLAISEDSLTTDKTVSKILNHINTIFGSKIDYLSF